MFFHWPCKVCGPAGGGAGARGFGAAGGFNGGRVFKIAGPSVIATRLVLSKAAVIHFLIFCISMDEMFGFAFRNIRMAELVSNFQRPKIFSPSNFSDLPVSR